MALKTNMDCMTQWASAAAGLFPHFFCRIVQFLADLTGSISRPKNPSKTCPPRGPPLLLLHLVKNAESFNLIDTCSKQAATGYSLELLNCIAEETVAPFAVPRTGSKVALRHQNAGPKMGPFSEPSRNVPILRGTKNGSEFRANF